MKFFSAAAAAAILLGADAVLASPVNLVPRAPRAAKRSPLRRTRPMIADATASGTEAAAPAYNNSTNPEYSDNWAGAVQIGTGYTSVYGKFVVPTPKLPPGGDSSGSYSASAWVGIDGDTCQAAILQTGVDFNYDGGSVSFSAWYEWLPDYAYNFDGFEISAGDEIGLTATASSTTSGFVLVENLTTGKQVKHSFANQKAALCETNAEWIVEDFEENGELVPFVDFGTVTFTDASVKLSDGSTIGVSGATVMDIKQSGTVYTKCAVKGSSGVTCTYV